MSSQSSGGHAGGSTDFSKLKDPNFDCSQWINDLFRTSGASEDRSEKSPLVSSEQESLATGVVMKLQLYIQEVNKSLDDVIQQTVVSLPRVVRDIEAVRHDTLILHNHMTQVKSELQTLSTETRQSMQSLIQLDREHSRIEQVLNCLQQADNWSSLTVQIEDCFLADDTQAISEKLCSLQLSLDSLKGYPEYESRRETLDRLKNRAEDLLSDQAQSAFRSHDAEEFATCQKFFQQIDREETMFKYYHQFHKYEFQKKWVDICSEGYETVSDQLTVVFGELQSLLEEEQKFLRPLVEKSPAVLTEMVAQCILALEPSLTTVMKDSLDATSPRLVIDVLADLHSVERNFVDNIEFCVSYKNTRLHAAVFATLVPIMLNFEKHLANKMNPVLKEFTWNCKDFYQAITMLEDSKLLVSKASSDALSVCGSITENVSILSAVSAVNQLYVNYCGKISLVLESLSTRYGFSSKKGDSPSKLRASEDWGMFQHATQITSILGQIRSEVEALEKHVVEECLLKSLPQLIEEAKDDKECDYIFLKIWSPAQWEKLVSTVDMATKLESGTSSLGLTSTATSQLDIVIGAGQKLTLDTVMVYIETQFGALPAMGEWMEGGLAEGAVNKQLPTFSLAPLEYITRVGQFLMSLPAQLDILDSDPQLQQVFSRILLPECDDRPGEGDSIYEFWFGLIVERCMKLYLAHILLIPQLTDEGARHLAADIGYLQNVLDDIGLQLSHDLYSVLQLMNSPRSELNKLNNSVPHHLYAAVVQKRR